MKALMTILTVLAVSACAVSPAEPVPAKASTEVLAESTQSWDGGDFGYPPGEAQLTVARIHIPAGVTLPTHCHPVPLGGVLAKGVLEVRKEDGQKLLLKEGEGLIEVSNQWHGGHALEEVDIIVVYAGAEGIPVTVLKDGDPQLAAQCR